VPRPTLPSIPPGSANDDQLRLVARMVHFIRGCAGKTVKFLDNACHTGAPPQCGFFNKGRYIKRTCMTFTFYLSTIVVSTMLPVKSISSLHDQGRRHTRVKKSRAVALYFRPASYRLDCLVPAPMMMLKVTTSIQTSPPSRPSDGVMVSVCRNH